MENGRIIERGPVAQVFTAPQAPLTVDFVETSTNVRAAIERITRTIKLSELADDQELIAFKFVGQSTKQGIVSHLSQTLGVDVNILFANIDQIDGQNVGDMIAIITGNLPAFNQAIAQLADQGVQTHVINEPDVKELVD